MGGKYQSVKRELEHADDLLLVWTVKRVEGDNEIVGSGRFEDRSKLPERICGFF